MPRSMCANESREKNAAAARRLRGGSAQKRETMLLRNSCPQKQTDSAVICLRTGLVPQRARSLLPQPFLLALQTSAASFWMSNVRRNEISKEMASHPQNNRPHHLVIAHKPRLFLFSCARPGTCARIETFRVSPSRCAAKRP